MYKLAQVKISGFWGTNTVITDFSHDVNIFVGKNGTGKTTFINLVQAALSADLEMLSVLEFEEIKLVLNHSKSVKTIRVKKMADQIGQYREIEYQISTFKYRIPILPRDLYYDRMHRGRIHPRLVKSIEDLKSKLSKLIKLSFISVHRDEIVESEEPRRRKDAITSGVDIKLLKLMNDFTRYQLELETEISRCSTQFQKDVLKTMLFNNDLDVVSIDQKIEVADEQFDEMRLKLENAYKDLNILDKKVKEGIVAHIDAIRNAVNAVNRSLEPNSNGLFAHDVTPLTLYRRTKKIIDFSAELQAQKSAVMRPISDYIKLLKEFVEEKHFVTSNKASEGLTVLKSGQTLSLNQLSSGEKQLIILLTEALLQKNKPTVFIADEPEISLHIQWQRKILPSLMSLNPNAQIILATHSPEIVGKWRGHAVNMSGIVHG